VFSTGYIKEELLFTLIASLVLISLMVKGENDDDKPEFVSAYWKMAWKRRRYLLISYMVSVSVIGLGWLMTSTQTKKIL